GSSVAEQVLSKVRLRRDVAGPKAVARNVPRSFWLKAFILPDRRTAEQSTVSGPRVIFGCGAGRGSIRDGRLGQSSGRFGGARRPGQRLRHGAAGLLQPPIKEGKTR